MAFIRSLLLLTSLFSAAQSQVVKPGNCPNGGVHIIAARGHGTPSGYGGLNLTVDAIRQKARNTTSFPVPYYTYPSPNYDFAAEVENGTKVMTQNVYDFVNSCPNSPIVLLGYSEGAVIMMNMLCGASEAGFDNSPPINASYAQNMIAIIALGDESRIPNQPYNLGSCTASGTAPRRNPAGCAAFQSVMQSYCDSTDPLCCNGNNQTVHHQYPQEYDDQISTYVQQQLASFKASSSNSTGAATSSLSSSAAPVKTKGTKATTTTAAPTKRAAH